MRSLAKESAENLKALFDNTSVKSGLSPAIVEKDFWVCLALDYLFKDSPWRKHLAFKGGTSLSKAFNLIKRFSEDIDLILDWRLIGYGIDEPWRERSNTQQDIFNEQANGKSADFLRDEFVPKLKRGLGEIVARELDIRIDEDDPNTVVFAYPCVFTDSAILREIRIESGSLAAWTPARPRPISPYAELPRPSRYFLHHPRREGYRQVAGNAAVSAAGGESRKRLQNGPFVGSVPQVFHAQILGGCF